MKQIYTTLLIICFALLGNSYAQAQNTPTSYGIQIGDIDMKHISNRLEVDFSIVIDGVKIRSNQALRITPFVTNGKEMMQLPAVIIDGRRRHIVHERNYNMEESANTYIRHRKKEIQEIDYQTDVPFESWMSKSELILREECIACHDLPLDEALITVAMLNEHDSPAACDPANMSCKPELAYITPHNTPSGKAQSIEIFFPVNKSNISASFMDNSTQISQLSNHLKQSGVKNIHLMGYASPEGPYAFNESLAAKRAEAVKKHMTANSLATDAEITTNSSPADWNEVKRLLSESCIENYLKIIDIIDDNTIALADKNKTIKAKYPVAYDFMLRTWYPKLRKTEITIESATNIEQAKAQLKSDPSKLSLEDIYMIALTYDKGSKEWEEIIIIAVDTYPQSPEARINAANVAMANGNYEQAAAYLKDVPADIPQAMNSRGILAMANGDYPKAMQLFQAAEQAGVSEAAQNIALLKQLMAAEN